ncbi:PiggyBac transposable element-derived protein 1 [Lucilia cuprina]|nr:PiggyBac transposable element-derived protein 1 [Lucilia cuprina]
MFLCLEEEYPLISSQKSGHFRRICFIDNAYVEEEHSVDEAMVPYTGDMVASSKLIRYGFKFWVGTTRKGYINWFEPYQGASYKY